MNDWNNQINCSDDLGEYLIYVICNNCRREYLNQLGILRVQYMMEKVYLITSPKWCQWYTNGKAINNYLSYQVALKCADII